MYIRGPRHDYFFMVEAGRDLGPVIQYQAVALEVKIRPDEAERAGCSGITAKRDNDVWP